MRRNIRINNCVLLLIASLISIGHPPPLADGSPLGFPPLPFIRGGSATATATRTRTVSKKQRQQQRRQRSSNGPNLPGPLKLIGNVKQGLDKIGSNIQNDWKKNQQGHANCTKQHWKICRQHSSSVATPKKKAFLKV
mmetsp:Transcript_26655/g.41818  ORF Transcript_26655/g.41818 Transcript_26655/m.41818 type:complete len:137 (+) Transcript_26655:188-598(+)